MEFSTLSSCVQDPRVVHYDAGLVVVGYLVATKRFGITYGGKLRVPYGMSEMPPHFEISGGLYTAHDSSWGSRPRPLGGYVVMYNNGAIDWAARQIKIVPDSTCQAETAVGSIATKATCFVRAFLFFHKRAVTGPTAMLGDNKAMVEHVQQDGASSKTRHYERATLLIKRAVLMLLLKPYLVSTHLMIADIFTKAVEKEAFVRYRNVMMNCHVSLREILRDSVNTVHGEARLLVTRLLGRV